MTFTRSAVSRSLTAFFFLAAISTLPAQSVVTDPVGFTTLTVAGKPGAARSFTFLALNMTRPTAYQSGVPAGGVSAGGSPTVLTFAAGSFTAGQFVTGTAQNPSHFIEVTNGSGAGVLADITANTTNTITLSEDLSPYITGGTTTIKVRPHWTFSAAFGANNSAGFLGGLTASVADNIVFLNPVTNTLTTYFYHSTNNRWQRGGADASNDIIRLDAGFIVERKTVPALSFTVVGEVKLGPTEVVIAGAATNESTIAPNMYPLASKRLADIGLFTGNPATGVVGGLTASTADNLIVSAPGGGSTTTYFYHSTNNRWQRGGADASNDTIPEGASVLITRKAGRPSFSWIVPQPTMNL